LQEELALVQQSLEEKTKAEKELKSEVRSLQAQLGKTKHSHGSNQESNRKMERELWSVTAEKIHFEDVLQRI